MGIKKIIAIFLLIAVLLMPVAVFADIPIPDPPAGAYPYWVVIQNGRYIQLISAQEPITVFFDGLGQPNLNYRNFKVYDLSDNDWVFNFSSHVGGGVFDDLYASNHDIAYTDGSGFFFTPPKVSPLFLTAQETDFGMIWTIILDGLIPLAGLLILGISFRKGWAFLRNQLTH